MKSDKEREINLEKKRRKTSTHIERQTKVETVLTKTNKYKRRKKEDKKTNKQTNKHIMYELIG